MSSDPKREAFERARQAWPGVQLGEAEFAAYLNERGAEAQGEVSELYLCCACAKGDAQALAQFERLYLPRLDPALMEALSDEQRVDEVKQTLRQRLLVGSADTPPRIVQYQGRGKLIGWLRVAALREALRQRRGLQRERPTRGEALESLAGAGDSPELNFLKAKYRADFKVAFEEALGTLSPRQRNILRYNFVDGLNIEEIGQLYGKHRATVARWIAGSREQLMGETRRRLTAALKLSGEELESVMRLIRSQLHVSIERILSPDSEQER